MSFDNKLRRLVCDDAVIPSNFTDTNIGQFAFAVFARGVADGLCTWKVGIFVVILVLPACEALNLSIRVANVTILGLKMAQKNGTYL